MKPSAVAKFALASALALCLAPLAGATTYTNDTNISDFTSLVTSYATFSYFSNSDGCTTSPFTPTSAELASTTSACRVYGGTFGAPPNLNPASNNWILATFNTATASILVFPNIDHYGSAYDGYQYQIWGSNDGTNWTMLFDALTVTGASEPFTLGTYLGIAPYQVNNVITGGTGPGGTIGYEAFFNFGTAYKYFAFGASTEGINAGNADQELSAVGSLSGVTPEPSSLLLIGTGLLGLAGALRRKLLA